MRRLILASPFAPRSAELQPLLPTTSPKVPRQQSRAVTERSTFAIGPNTSPHLPIELWLNIGRNLSADDLRALVLSAPTYFKKSPLYSLFLHRLNDKINDISFGLKQLENVKSERCEQIDALSGVKFFVLSFHFSIIAWVAAVGVSLYVCNTTVKWLPFSDPYTLLVATLPWASARVRVMPALQINDDSMNFIETLVFSGLFLAIEPTLLMLLMGKGPTCPDKSLENFWILLAFGLVRTISFLLMPALITGIGRRTLVCCDLPYSSQFRGFGSSELDQLYRTIHRGRPTLWRPDHFIQPSQKLFHQHSLLLRLGRVQMQELFGQDASDLASKREKLRLFNGFLQKTNRYSSAQQTLDIFAATRAVRPRGDARFGEAMVALLARTRPLVEMTTALIQDRSAKEPKMELAHLSLGAWERAPDDSSGWRLAHLERLAPNLTDYRLSLLEAAA